MERPGTNASEHVLNNKTHENECVIFSDSTNKRKGNDKSVDCENKKKCLARSSSTTSNNITNHLKENWKYEQKICSEGFENFCEICRYKYENTCPNRLISFMYQLELSVLCLHRKYSFKKSSESVIFRNSVNGQFNNIVLCFEGDNFCIKVQHVDTFYSPKSLNFNSFFSSISGNFTLSNYLNEFAAELICYSDCVTDAPKYLIIYTNSALDIVNGKFFNKPQPEFCHVNAKTQKDLFNLFKRDGEFYQFSNERETREYLNVAVKFTRDIVEQMGINGFLVEEVRSAFFDRLIFAVNQPSIEELIDMVRKEVLERNEDFLKLRNEVMRQLTMEDCEKEFLQSTLYSFNLLMYCLHNLYLNKIFSIKYEERNETQNIRIDNFFFLKALEFDISKLSPEEFIKQREIFSVNSHFLTFLQELNCDRNHEFPDGFLVVYTNVSLSLLEELILGNRLTTKGEDAKYRPKFTRINAEEKRFRTLRQFVKENYLYQFSEGETRKKLLDLLNITQCSKKITIQIKNLFLDKIVFAVNQHTSEELYKKLANEISDSKVFYNCQDLCKIGLRSLKSHESTPMTRELIKTLLFDLRNNEKSENIFANFFQKEIDLAKQVLRPDLPEFGQFVDFLIKGKGKECLATMRKNGIEIPAFFTIIQGSEPWEVENVFLDLYKLSIDARGEKSDVFKFFEMNGFSMNCLSKMLSAAGSRGATTLYDLYQQFSNNTNLRTLMTHGMKPSRIVTFFDRTGADCCENIKEFYTFWFDDKSSKKMTLKNLETNGIRLSTLSNILQKSGNYYKKLYHCWFDKGGEKTVRLKNLEKIGVPLSKVCAVLRNSGQNASDAFRRLYDLFFERCGRKTRYLKILEKEKVNALMILDILPKTGIEVEKIFLKLFGLWFERTGERTASLKILLANGKNLPHICRFLSGSGVNSIEKFQYLLKTVKPKVNLTVKKEKIKMEFSDRESGSLTEEEIKKETINLVVDDQPARGIIESKVISDQEVKKEVETEETLKKLVGREIKLETVLNRSSQLVKEMNPELLNQTKKFVSKELDKIEKVQINSKSTTNCTSVSDSFQVESFSRIIFDPISLEYKTLFEFLLQNLKSHFGILGILQNENITYKQVANVLKGCETATEVIKTLNELYSFWFDNNGEMKPCLRILENNSIKLSEIVTIFNESGINAVEAFQNLHRLWFDAAGDKTRYLTSFEENEISVKTISAVFKASGRFAAETIQEFYDLFFDPIGGKSRNLRILQAERINLQSIFAILENTGPKASGTFRQLFNVWFDLNKKSERLVELEETGIGLNMIVKFLQKKGLNAIETFESLYKFIFATENKECFKNLEKEIPLSAVFEIITDFDVQMFKKLYQVWFDGKGDKTPSLQLLEKNGVNLKILSTTLKGSGLQSFYFYEKLNISLFDEKGQKTERMKNIESVTELKSMLEMISGANERINEAFESLYKLWFDEKGKKSNCLLILEKKNIGLEEVSVLLSGSGILAVGKFKKLCLIVGHNNLPKIELIENFKKYYLNKSV
ncbi:uncharacterized protein LOC122509641 [Leptopilina heterotoma]|uniref:uncharacterized protein LOC122509641 n=1 Tax=Leptopilina heterotoma TaxID=63436 RepID=UPI001CA96C72|nr:uncharacterized protein LOC122509641 [Leptopilina heterotoma]